MTLVAGVDSSTQSCKVEILAARTGTRVRTGRAAHPAGTAVDPEMWWIALLGAISGAGGLEAVGAISVGGQQHGMVTLDEGGRVIRDALLWNDTRSADAAAALVAEVGAADYVRRTGVVPVASFTAAKLRWLREAEPANAARVAAVALPHDWLTWRLRGFGPANPDLTELTTDRSDASGTAYWGDDGYDLDLLTRALGREVTLPRVLGPSESAGFTARIESAGAVVVPAGITVGPGAGDNAGAALGLGLREGDIAVSIGTSGTAFASTPAQVRDVSGTVAGFADACGGYLPIVTTLNAAQVLDQIAALLGVSHDELGRLALIADPGSGGLVLQPFFEGERTPNRPDATATLFNLTLGSTTRENLARAAFEGILCGLATGVGAITDLGVEARRILLIGGAAQNPALQRIATEVFDAPITVPVPGEYVARGAARQAAWVLSGNLPEWPVDTAVTYPSGHVPGIRAQYNVRL